jgi:hypothetical protein
VLRGFDLRKMYKGSEIVKNLKQPDRNSVRTLNQKVFESKSSEAYFTSHVGLGRRVLNGLEMGSWPFPTLATDGVSS